MYPISRLQMRMIHYGPASAFPVQRSRSRRRDVTVLDTLRYVRSKMFTRSEMIKPEHHCSRVEFVRRAGGSKIKARYGVQTIIRDETRMCSWVESV